MTFSFTFDKNLRDDFYLHKDHFIILFNSMKEFRTLKVTYFLICMVIHEQFIELLIFLNSSFKKQISIKK